MTKEELEQYRSKKAEIKELRNKLANMEYGDVMTSVSTILNYKSGYPVPEGVRGVDWPKVFRVERQYRKRIEQLEAECQIIEDYVENISDSLTRRIFRLRFIDGLTQYMVSRQIHLSQSAVSKKIYLFLKME